MSRKTNTKNFIKWKCPNCFWTIKWTQLVNCWLLFSLLQGWTGLNIHPAVCQVGTTQSQCIHYFSSAVFAPSQSLNGSTHAHTVREKGIRTLGKIRSRQQLPPEHWSWPAAQPPWAVRSGYWELFWQWPPLPRYSVRRISPLAVTSLSRVVVAAGTGQCCSSGRQCWAASFSAGWAGGCAGEHLPTKWPGITYCNKSLNDG